MSFPLERTRSTQNFPFPADRETVYENSPCMIWVPVEGAKKYRVTVLTSERKIYFQKETDKNFIFDNNEWESGKYFWDVEADNGCKRGEMSFTISEDAIIAERPLAQSVYDSVDSQQRPRHLFFRSDIPDIIEEHNADIEILKRNVDIAYAHGMPEKPKYQHSITELPYREYFGSYRDYCDRDLIACALLYSLTGDKKAGAHAKELILCICDMNPLGPCSLMGEWGDEVGLSNARCLPSAFDLLYDLLDEKQRRYVAKTVAVYAKQCLDRINKINYFENPSNSHVGRIPAYLGEAALVLKGTGVESDETLIDWLSTALDVYNGIFPFYGCRDGSWAEGSFYSSSYTKWYLPFFSAVERFSGKSLFTRLFYMRYTQYLIHFCNSKYENHPFGDGYWCHPQDQEWPGFFAQNPYRAYAQRFGPDQANIRMKEACETDYFRLHLLDVFLPKSKRIFDTRLVGQVENCHLFDIGGFAALHTDIDSDDDICVLIRASRYNAESHRHADQGSFALYCGGKALISPSGYFGRQYGTKHHFQWTVTTIAHNVALIDGKCQKRSIDAVGKFIYFDKENKRAVVDVSSAYDGVIKYQREFSLDECGMTVTDTIITLDPVTVTYPLHSLACPHSDGKNVVISRDNCELTVCMLSDNMKLERITDKYEVELNEGEPEQYHVEMPKQYHIYYKSESAKEHTVKVRYMIKR